MGSQPHQPKLRKRLGLAAVRIAAGLTQEDLARQLDVERTTVYRWESGESTPRPWTRPKLAKLLGLDNLLQLAALLDGASYESIQASPLSRPPNADQSRTETGEAPAITDSPSTSPAIPSAADYAEAPGPSDELAILALLGAVISGHATSQDQATIPLTDLDRLMDMMKRRGILYLLGQLTAGGTLASPALGGLRLLSDLDLNPDEQERVTKAIISPERVDEQIIRHIETMLWACQRQDDTFGPQVVLTTVQEQQRLVHNVLLPARPDHLLPRLLSLYGNLCCSAGWYFFDLNDFDLAWREFEKGRKAAHDAGNTELSIYALCNMSYAAAWHGYPHTGLDYAAAARSLAIHTGDPLLQVCAADKTAHSYAADGQYAGCRDELDNAQTVLSGSAGRVSPGSLAYYYTDGFLANQTSHSLLRLGKSREAVASARAGLAMYDRSFARDFAFYTLCLGKALTLSQEIDEAATAIAEAAILATQNGSTRLIKELHTARAAMQPWQETRAVRELDEQLVGLGLQASVRN